MKEELEDSKREVLLLTQKDAASKESHLARIDMPEVCSFADWICFARHNVVIPAQATRDGSCDDAGSSTSLVNHFKVCCSIFFNF